MMPEAGSAWPSDDLDASSLRGARPAGRPSTRAAAAAPTSMGSPRPVPVPCSCRPATWCADAPAACSAARITSCWEGPLGAVRELERPSWLTAAPASRIAAPPPPAGAALSTMTAQASERT
jgi:hypothetical protein